MSMTRGTKPSPSSLGKRSASACLRTEPNTRNPFETSTLVVPQPIPVETPVTTTSLLFAVALILRAAVAPPLAIANSGAEFGFVFTSATGFISVFLLRFFESARRCVAVSLPAHANAAGHRLVPAKVPEAREGPITAFYGNSPEFPMLLPAKTPMRRRNSSSSGPSLVAHRLAHLLAFLLPAALAA